MLLRLKAQLFVDASGMSAVLRKASPWLDKKCKSPSPEHICVAAQAVYKFEDIKAAREFLGQYRIESGEVLGWVGVEGGFSILRPELDLGHKSFSILTGSIAKQGIRSGKKILDDFVADLPWLGEPEIYGHRAIPLRRPYAHQVAPGVALLGDAGSHIFSSHGSGIGISLIAARILSEAVGMAYASGADIGTVESLWNYPKKFHRRYGGLLGFADAMRRFTQSLTADETRMMFDEGILTVGMARDGLGQFKPTLAPGEAIDQLRGLMKTLPLAAKLVRVLGRIPAIYTLAANYPGRPAQSRVTVSAWDYAMSRLVESVSVE
jgi:flavin-dependent dehydrogenase